ncbi:MULTISPECIES: NADPH-dependent F420 reductase [Sphingobium]|uniref:NADPH-dependent F420 reductase n=1 Tax=Sphingobium TaxID=165695 RepID=UPI00159C3162|nr:NAD(P)-binding domain-containing protein [Sphingobium sp. 15-1]
MATIGIIGSGMLGSALAETLTRAGHSVIIANSRGPQSLADLTAAIGANAAGGSLEQAASHDIVIYASRWVNREEILGAFPSWGRRIFVDASNHYLTHAPDFIKDDLGGETSSEIMSRLVPGARVVKAFNSVFSGTLRAGGTVEAGRRVLFMSGDDADAKATVGSLIADIGFHAMDLGSLRDGGRMQQLGSPIVGMSVDLVQVG